MKLLKGWTWEDVKIFGIFLIFVGVVLSCVFYFLFLEHEAKMEYQAKAENITGFPECKQSGLGGRSRGVICHNETHECYFSVSHFGNYFVLDDCREKVGK